MRLLIGEDAKVARWVAKRIPLIGPQGFGPATAIGVLDSGGNALCGVVYHDYQPQFSTMSFTIASATPRWAHRNIIRQLFAYPFEQVGVEKLWTATPANNRAALRLCKGVGMIQEATLYKHFGPHNAIINRMMRKDYIRLYVKDT